MRIQRAAVAIAVSSLTLVSLAACGTRVDVATQASTAASSGDSLGLDGNLGASTATPDATPGQQSASPGTGGDGTSGASEAPASSYGPTGSTQEPTGQPTTSTSATTPVEIGFLVSEDVGKAAAALGYGGLSTGDGPTQAQAMVKLLNSQGGIGGRQIKPVIFKATANDSTDTIGSKACAMFTQDHHVKAAVGILLPPVLLECLNKKKVPYIGSAVSSVSARTLAANPLLVLSYMLTIEDAAKNLIDGLIQQNWFRTVTKDAPVIGLITHDDPDYANVKGIVEAALKAAGLTLKDTSFMPVDGIPAATTAGKSTALKFKAEGVNRVITVDKNGFATSWFAIGAGGQGYYPKLAFSTLAEPSIEPTVLTPRQLAGAAGIGWSTLMDTTPKYQPVLNPRTTECIKTMAAASQDMTLGSVRLAAMSVCDGSYLLHDVFASGDVSADGLTNGLKALGKGFKSPVTFATDFSRSRAPISAFKRIAYHEDCDCFRYEGALSSVG